MGIEKLLGSTRIVPVVTIDEADLAVPLAEVLLASGLGVIEITLRTAVALKAIENVARRVPGMIVGAGSIRRWEQIAQVQEAGAHFGISPGSTNKLVNEALRLKIPFIPGATTPSEILELLEQGFTLQKFFPAELAGGLAMLRALASPVPEAQFMPTGGISPELAVDYLAQLNVAAIDGSWIAPPSLINARDFDQIEWLARQAARLQA
jgi:2-dehydro-3-deoxyphosphogluconate aldolase/(4S)-4-hydroxy-2-oxoglutarate aldolase